MDVDFADLRALVVLAETLHFGRAADRLNVSQPALSKRIRRMEERIGGPLLVRRYRDVRLTEAGRLLADHGRHLLHESAAAVMLSQRAARGEAGLLRIGFGIASILGLLPDVLLRFRRAYPAVQLHLRDMSTPEQVNALVDEVINELRQEGKAVPAHGSKGEKALERQALAILVGRARRIQRFLSQNLFVAEQFTGQPGSFVPLAETVQSFQSLTRGDYDHLPEQAFFLCGGIEDVEKKAAELAK